MGKKNIQTRKWLQILLEVKPEGNAPKRYPKKEYNNF